MREERGDSNCFVPASYGLVSITRREFVGGVATTAALVCSDANAQDIPLSPVKSIREPSCPSTIGVEVQLLGPNSSATPKWQLFAESLGGSGQPHLLPYGDPSPQGFSFDNVALFTNSPIGLECHFAEVGSAPTRVWMIDATLKSIPMSELVPAPAVELAQFLAGKEALVFTIAPAATAELAKAWFGGRIEFNRADSSKIWLWFDPVKRTQRLEVTPVQGKISAFSGAIQFSKLTLSRVGSQEGEGAAIRINGKQAAFNRGWTLLGVADGVLWSHPPEAVYDFGRKPNTRLILSATGNSPRSVVFRSSGDPVEALAILRAPLRATLATANAEVPSCQFRLDDALLLRRAVKVTQPKQAPATYDQCGVNLATNLAVNIAKPGDPEPPVDLLTSLRGRLSTKHFSVETAYGAFEIGGDLIDEEKEKANPLDLWPRPERGLTHLIAEAKQPAGAPADADALQSLDVRGLLTHMSVAVPERSEKEPAPPPPSDTTWSRLDFDGSEIALCLSGDVERARASGARGIVTLAEKPRPLAPEGQPAQVAIALDGAALKLRRASDHLALTLQFRRLVLELGLHAGRIAPNARIGMTDAGLASARTDSGLVSVRTEVGSASDMRTDARLGFDNRPLLIATFPPQHVAEQVYYRMVNGAALPESPTAIEQAKAAGHIAKLNELRASKSVTARKAYHDELVDYARPKRAPSNGPPSSDPSVVAATSYLDLDELLSNPSSWVADLSFDGAAASQSAGLLSRWNALSDDQKIYLGADPLAIDPDARAIILAVWNAYQRKQGERLVGDQLFEDRVRQMPDVPLPDEVTNEVKRRSGNDLMALLAKEKGKRDDDYQRAYDMYGFLYKCRASAGTKVPASYISQDDLRAAYYKDFTNADKMFIVDLLTHVLAELRKQDDADVFLALTPARLSGPSRLVFRVDNDVSRQSIPFTFDGLTDWGAFDLAVTRRAETAERLVGDRLPHAAFRTPESDAEAVLAYQNIRPGRSIEGRLADIRASLVAPGPAETSIELPFRLILSPDQFGRFRTRRPIPARVFSDKRAPSVEPHLWSANLDATQGASKLRAVWSPDFRPEAFGQVDQAPRHGPYAPWEGVLPERERANFRTALDAYDRHEIVALSSVYGLPVLGRRAETLNFIDASQFEPPAAYKLRGLKKYDYAGNTDLSGIYNPQSLAWTELRLTALGGSLNHDTQFVPPASALRVDDKPLFDAFSVERWRQLTVLGRDIEVEVVYKGYLFPLGVRASLVKVSERRFLRNPATGHITAFLIQRKFIRCSQPEKQFPVAGQPNNGVRFPVSQFKLITVTTPDILDPDADRSGGAPEKVLDGAASVAERPGGRLDVQDGKMQNLAGLVFWPRTRPGQTGNIQFQFTVNGDAVALSMPMMFVDNVAVNRADVLAAVTAYYNNSAANVPLRTIAHFGRSRRYAEETADGECSFETQSWVVQAEGRLGSGPNISRLTANAYFVNDPLLEGAEQPPFYPFLEKCTIRVGQAERFVGRPLEPREARYFAPYVANGGFQDANDQTERYLELIASLSLKMGTAGDRSGGIARPEMDIRWLARKQGLVGGPTGSAPPLPPATEALVPAPPPSVDWKSFFNGGAKLLGLISFADLLSLTLAAGTAPKLKERVDAATDDVAETIKTQVLPALAQAVDYFDQSWARAQAALAARTGQKLDLLQVYPDIKPALDDLRNKLTEASTSSSANLVQKLTEVQQSGRRLVTVIERTAADPIAPMQESIRDQFRKYTNDIADLALGFQTRLAKALDGIEARLKDSVLLAIRSNPGVPKLFFALPMPVPDPAGGLGNAADLAKDLDETTAEAASTFVSTFITTSDRTQAARAARDRAIALLTEQVNARTQSGQTAVAAALAKYRAELTAIVDAEISEVAGFVVDTLADALTALVALDGVVTAGGRDLLTKIGVQIDTVVAKIASLLVDQAVQKAFTNAAAWCQTQVGNFEQFAKSGLPEPKQLTDLVTEVRDIVQAFVDPDALASTLAQLDRIAKSYGAAYQLLAAPGNAAACTSLQLAPFYTLRTLINLRGQAIAQLASLFDTLGKSQIDQSSDGAAALMKLQGARGHIGGLIPSADPALQPIQDVITSFGNVNASGGKARDQAVQAQVGAARDKLQDYIKGVKTSVQALNSVNDTAAKAFSIGLGAALDQANATLNDIQAKLIDVLAMMLVSAQPLATALTNAIGQMVQPCFAALASVYVFVDGVRRDASSKIYPAAGAGAGTMAQILALLISSKGRAAPGNIFVVPRRPPTVGGDPFDDAFTDELKLLQRLSTIPLGAPDAYLDDILGLAQTWRSTDPALLRLAQNIGDATTAVLRGDIAQFIDLQQVREQVDQAIRQMVPRRIVRSYDMQTGLGDIGQIVKFRDERPNPKTQGKDLLIQATGVVDLVEPKNSTASATGYLPGFELRLLPAIGIDVATLYFPQSTFHAAPGQPFNFSLKVEDVKLGSAVQFLQTLQSFISSPKSGNGFYLRAMTEGGRFGIVAGYGLALGPISIGNIYLSHLSLNCAAELPLDDDDARFVISIGRPEAPFIISAAPYAGAGYLGFIANTGGIVGFEASMQYGGGGGFSFGPLTGEGRITMGIFIRTYKGHTELYGLFFAGGSAQIACFSCSTSLLVRLTQTGGNLSGDATFTFSFSIGIRDIEFAVTVQKTQQGGGGSSSASLLDGPGRGLTRFALGLAPGGRTTLTDAMPFGLAGGGPRFAQAPTAGSNASPPIAATLQNKTTCKGVNYGIYRDYFASPSGPPAPPPAPSPAAPPPPPAGPAAKANPKQKNAQPKAPPPPPSPPAAQTQPSPWLFL